MLFRSLVDLLSPEKSRSSTHNLLVIPPRFLSGKQVPIKLSFFSPLGEPTLNLEDVFCSKTRMKTLKLLFQYGQLNTSDIMRKLGVNYKITVEHLELLGSEGVVEHRSSGRTRFFRFASTLTARATVKLLEEWEKK
jgi:DNA-binding transcriptional ArsR family regulator